MADGIFLIQGGTLTELIDRQFETETVFQELLASNPSLLAGSQINPNVPRRWLLVRREMGIPAEEAGGDRWSIDHLFLDQDGIPTLVEVKRSTDTRLRRELVGQMLDTRPMPSCTGPWRRYVAGSSVVVRPRVWTRPRNWPLFLERTAKSPALGDRQVQPTSPQRAHAVRG